MTHVLLKIHLTRSHIYDIAFQYLKERGANPSDFEPHNIIHSDNYERPVIVALNGPEDAHPDFK